MSKKKLDSLLEDIRNTDFTINNPQMQQVIEEDLSRWVQSYEYKKKGQMSDFYGKPGEIPDQISVYDNVYSPSEILVHVKARDDVGMEVLRTIDTYQKQDEGWMIEEYVDSFEGSNPNLKEVVAMCMCGKHDKTLREILEDIANVSSESIFIKGGLMQGIKKWYSESRL